MIIIHLKLDAHLLFVVRFYPFSLLELQPHHQKGASLSASASRENVLLCSFSNFCSSLIFMPIFKNFPHSNQPPTTQEAILPSAHELFFCSPPQQPISLYNRYRLNFFIGNTADMLSQTRYKDHFTVTPRQSHKGLFACSPTLCTPTVVSSGGKCC